MTDKPCSLCKKPNSNIKYDICKDCTRAVKSQEAERRAWRNKRVKELLEEKRQNHALYEANNLRINSELSKLGRSGWHR